MRLRSLDPSLVPPIEASPQLIYSHYGRPTGGVGRPSPNERPIGGVWRPSPNERPTGGVWRPSPNETNSQRKQSGSEGGQDQVCSMPARHNPFRPAPVG